MLCVPPLSRVACGGIQYNYNIPPLSYIQLLVSSFVHVYAIGLLRSSSGILCLLLASTLHNTTHPHSPVTRKEVETHHVSINRRTEHSKSRTPYNHSLRPRIPRQHTARDTASRDAIVQIVFRPQPLDRTLGPAEDRAHFGEVLPRGNGRAVHVAQPVFQLLLEREVGDAGLCERGGCCWCGGRAT